jgi:endo-1,4-beta-mannosidase
MRDQAGVSVLRFWAYQSYTNGGTDFSRFDQLIASAKKANVKLLPVLDDQWFYCSHGPSKPQSWFESGYRSPYGTNALSYRDYVQRVVARYKGEPTIFAWSLMNEPDPIALDWNAKEWADRTQAKIVFRAWVADMAALVKSIDPNHLLTIGTLAEWWQDYIDFVGNHSLPTIDFATAHDYGKDDEAMPSRIADRMAEAMTQVGKPIVIGEAGMLAGPGTNRTLAQRATLLEAKLAAFFKAGGAGFLVWNFNKGGENYRVQPGDPLLPLMKARAGT